MTEEKRKDLAGPRKNITDTYDPARLAQVESIIQAAGPDGRTQTEEKAKTSVINMKDAINLSINEDYKSRIDLSAKQKKLIEVVAEERKTASGRMLTDEAANKNEWLTVDNNVQHAGAQYDSWHLIAITLKNDAEKSDLTSNRQALQSTLHHEVTHEHQNIPTQMPAGLSSYDQMLWYLGREGQAFVAVADEKRRREGKPPLTDEEKRKIFSSEPSGDYYARHYGIQNVTRSDGRRLTIEEYENAFGRVPGHESDDNFLKGGNYKDVTNIRKTQTTAGTTPVQRDNSIVLSPTFSDEVHYEAQQKPIRYEDLPKVNPNTTVRIESKDKKFIILVSNENNGSKAKIEIYRQKHLPDGAAYVKLPEATVATVETNIKAGTTKSASRKERATNYDISIPADNEGGQTIRLSVSVYDDGTVQANGAVDGYGTIHSMGKNFLKREDLPKTGPNTSGYRGADNSLIYFTVIGDKVHFQIFDQRNTPDGIRYIEIVDRSNMPLSVAKQLQQKIDRFYDDAKKAQKENSVEMDPAHQPKPDGGQSPIKARPNRAALNEEHAANTPAPDKEAQKVPANNPVQNTAAKMTENASAKLPLSAPNIFWDETKHTKVEVNPVNVSDSAVVQQARKSPLAKLVFAT